MANSGLNSREHPFGSMGRGIARGEFPAFKANHIIGGAMDGFHVLRLRSHIFGGVIRPAQTLDIVSEGLQKLRGLDGFRITDDYRFPAAQTQAGHGVFIAHAPRQAQHIENGIFFRADIRHIQRGIAVRCCIIPKAAAANGRAKHGRMNGNDRP